MGQKAPNIKKWHRVIKRILLSILALIVVLGIWQITEYRKFRGLLLAEDMPYAAHTKLPEIVQQTIIHNRQRQFIRPTIQQLSDLEARLFPSGLSLSEDLQTAKDAKESYEKDRTPPHWMSMGDVESDLDYLHRYMKYGFAGYAYYGGDDVFLPLLEATKAETEEAMTPDGIGQQEFLRILQKNVLPAVQDQHSFIGGMNYGQLAPEIMYHSYYSEEIVFEQQGQHYVTELNGTQYRLLSIDEEDLESALRLTILEDGTFAYIPWYYGNENETQTMSRQFVLSDDQNQTKQIDIDLTRIEPYTGDPSAYSLDETDDYFFLHNSSLQYSEDTELKKMVREADRLAEGKPVIIDLRDHGGGSDFYCIQWMMDFLGVSQLQLINIPIPSVNYDIDSRTLDTIRKGKFLNSTKEPQLKLRYEGGHPLHVRNEIPIVVLVDRGTGSSGEHFVSYLSRMDHVLIVGENTGGWLTGGNTIGTRLPNSRIHISFSSGFGLDTDLVDYEWMGYPPDIYVPPEMAAQRVIAMLERHEIS